MTIRKSSFYHLGESSFDTSSVCVEKAQRYVHRPVCSHHSVTILESSERDQLKPNGSKTRVLTDLQMSRSVFVHCHRTPPSRDSPPVVRDPRLSAHGRDGNGSQAESEPISREISCSDHAAVDLVFHSGFTALFF